MTHRSSMPSILRATAMLSGSSAIGILCGLTSAKLTALWLGPSGVGYLGLLQSLLALSALVAGMGVGTGLVRAGASALDRGDEETMGALYRAAWLLCLVFASLSCLVLVVWRADLGRWMLGGSGHASGVVLVAGALVLTLWAGVQTNALNAYHRVGALARVGAAGSLAGTVLTLALVWRWRGAGIAPAVVANAAAAFVVAQFAVHRQLPPARIPTSRRQMWHAALSLLRFGAPWTASMLVGTGIQLLLPILALHMLGLQSVGFFRAASAIAIGYLSFLLAAMAQDYYPRVSAASSRPAELVQLINQQQRLIMLLAVPMILGTLALAPQLVVLLYSSKFHPAATVLEWLLVGDLFKFSSWTMAFVVLARSGSGPYFGTELVGGSVTLAASLLCMYWVGLSGLGIGYLVGYVAYYGVVWTVVRRDFHLTWSQDNQRMMIAAIVLVGLAGALQVSGLGTVGTAGALAIAALAVLRSAYVLWNEVGSMRRVSSP